ncbi:LCP family protein [Streptomyces sp. ACA25]|uniref:LCP family protein n=1 Tax=Streptomyces sp. ACA25 TaxID=3022596 RepID=UPI0023071C76|nr:LCP family protein [Streptomyces sp. ACA25]MDB1087552.1 LCP family protein [Streptomyces sp. ACA25]
MGGGRRRRAAERPRSRDGRRRRVLIWVTGSVALVLLLAVGGAVWVYERLSGNIQSADFDDKVGGDRPDKLTGARTILVLGSDTREGSGGQYGGTDEMNSDTMMLVHVAENREWATVVSIPRDSWVEIPSCERGDGSTSQPHYAKVNSAYAIGGFTGDIGSAAACTIWTLEHNTGLRIDNFISLDFVGFQGMVDALGGVEMCLDEPIDDKKAHVSLEAGCQSLSGEEALGFVRVRYSVGDGSDLGRIGRQQEFMQALADRAQSKLTSPKALFDFMDAITKSLTTDPELAGLGPLHDLAAELQDIPKDRLTFLTVPNYPRELDVPDDTANVVWEYPEAELLFTALGRDEQVTEESLEEAAALVPDITPGEVRVRVLNGTGVPGQAAEVSEQLRAAGFQVVATGNAYGLTGTTVISYPDGLGQHADVLAGRVPGAATEQAEAETPGVLTLTIGSDFPGVR